MSDSKRAIKFRAWNNERKVMVPIQYLVAINQEFSEWGVNGYPRNETFELMQFTGLKDKNGKEIYEGDIVYRLYQHEETKKWLRDMMGIISWDDWMVGFSFMKPDLNLMRETNTAEFMGASSSIQGASGRWWEVIGNIYENPELLNA